MSSSADNKLSQMLTSGEKQVAEETLDDLHKVSSLPQPSASITDTPEEGSPVGGHRTRWVAVGKNQHGKSQITCAHKGILGKQMNAPTSTSKVLKRSRTSGNEKPIGRSDTVSRPKIDPKIVDSDSDESESETEQVGTNGEGISRDRSNEDGGNVTNNSLVDELPVSHEATLGSGHLATVSSISLDASGTRFVTTSYDQQMKFWDFGTMDNRLCSFRSMEPLDGYSVTGAEFSLSGSMILVYGASRSAKVLNRDGQPLLCCPAGDMYIVDMARTEGHVSQIDCGKWRPKMSEHFATVAGDSTMRLWDLNRPSKSQIHVVKLRNERGSKVSASSLCFSSDGRAVVVGCGGPNPCIKILDPTSHSQRPVAENRTAFGSHATEITSLSYSPQSCAGSLLLARSNDDSLRVFDVRRLEQPLAVFHDLPCAVSHTQAIFMGSSGEYFVTGTSSKRNSKENAKLVVFNRRSLSEIWQTDVDSSWGSIVSVSWHPRINQILCGCADGRVRVFYKPGVSKAGIMQCTLKHRRRKQHGFASVGIGEIVAPDSKNPAFRKRPWDSARSIPPARLPQPSDYPATNIADSDNTKSRVYEDPREALLRLDAETRRMNMFGTRSKGALAEKTAEQEEEESRAALRNRLGARQ